MFSRSRSLFAAAHPFIALISSHHIYADSKKEGILIGAENCYLGGIYLFGKPGRLVLEGERKPLERYLDEVFSWRWQDIRRMAPLMPTADWRRKSSPKIEAAKRHRGKKNDRSSSRRHPPPPQDQERSAIDEFERVFFDENRGIIFEEAGSEDQFRMMMRERGLSAAIPVIERSFSAPIMVDVSHQQQQQPQQH